MPMPELPTLGQRGWKPDLDAILVYLNSLNSGDLAVRQGYGLVAHNYDIANAVNASAPTNGQVIAVKVPLLADASVGSVCLGVGVIGATLTNGQNFAALYNSAGVLIDVTADQTFNWVGGGTGLKTMALVGGVRALTEGTYHVVAWSNGTTRPSFVRSSSQPVINTGITRFGAHSGTATTTPPASLTLSANNVAYWAGLA